MAKNTSNVYGLLDDLYDNCYPKAKDEIEELKDYAKELDGLDDFQPWDQSYYFTKLQKKNLILILKC